MTLRNYQKEATVTDIRPVSVKMVCNGYGLIGELEEVLQETSRFHKDNILKELGDVLWYCASICTCVGLDLQDIYESTEELQCTMPLPEVFKKAFRDNNGKFDDIAITNLKGYIYDFMCDISADDIDNITNINITKLASRHERGKIGGNGSNR